MKILNENNDEGNRTFGKKTNFGQKDEILIKNNKNFRSNFRENENERNLNRILL